MSIHTVNESQFLKAKEEQRPQRMAELVRSNETLREDLRQLQRENVVLSRRLAEASVARQTDRDSRRAALNLMEDAVIARQIAQQENLERRRIENELRLADRRKDEFLATLAHELRNPLAPLRNSLRVLHAHEVEPASIEQLHEMMERQVNHMARLVDDLMEVSRISRGTIQLRKEQASLHGVIASAVETSKPLIDAGHHHLSIHQPEKPVVLEMDPVRIEQVVCNLLNNAAKYTEDGGQIFLTVTHEDAVVTISVQDSGLGISADMVGKLFDLFTQINGANGRSKGGLGIGLWLVRKLVELHGGTVEARSDGLGYGCEFVVRLPAPERSAELICLRPQSSHPSAPIGQRILVVDDNRDAAESLGMLLRYLGAEVLVVNDGAAALRTLQSYHATVIFLDIGMPDMDGNEVARRVRLLPGGRDATLIALTGWDQAEDRRRCREAGFDHYLVKPAEVDEIEKLLNAR